MAKRTLLDIVQEILSDMNSDPVNSIGDTPEAQQVAVMVRRTFENLYNDRIWPRQGRLMELEAMSDHTRPSHMKLPESVIEIVWVKYDARRSEGDQLSYTDIPYMDPEEFILHVMSRNSLSANVETVMDVHGTPLLIYNDRAPSYYTSFDDEHLVFDSYDSNMDSTLRASKTQVFGYQEPEWIHEDNFVPQIPTKAFPYFINEAKAVCFLKIKEVFSQKDEQASNRQKAWLSRRKRHTGNGIRYPNYGRK